MEKQEGQGMCNGTGNADFNIEKVLSSNGVTGDAKYSSDLVDPGKLSNPGSQNDDRTVGALANEGSAFNGFRTPSPIGDYNSSSSDSSSSSGESCDDLGDPEDDEVSIGECYFCDKLFSSAELFLYEHLKKKHNVDVLKFQKKFSMDQIAYIQMTNYFRKRFALHEKLDNEKNAAQEEIDLLLLEINESLVAPWDKEVYLRPVIENDPMLSFFFEPLSEEEGGDKGPKDLGLVEGTIPFYVARIHQLEEENAVLVESRKKSEEFRQAMQAILARVMFSEHSNESPGIARKRTSPEAEGYFESYDEVGIHASMLGDKPRTSAYRDAFYFNRTDFQDKVVLDCGCGTGILSFFAIRSGASQVFAVDQSKIIYEAMHIATENRMDEQVRFIPGKIEDVEIPGKVDILISEFMGYFLLFEGMLSSYLTARDRFLKDGGLMFPNLAAINISGYDNEDKYDQIIGMWDDVYGVTMSAMKKRALEEPLIEHVKESEVATSTFNLLGLDLTTCAYEDAVIDKRFGLLAKRDTKLVALVGYFDVSFTQGSSRVVTLSTSPDSPLTHWNQCLFFLEKPVKVSTGEWVSGRFICKPSNANPRSLEVQITIGENDAHYEFR